MHLPARVPILYLILSVLILVSTVPLYFYGSKVVALNREQLKTNEQMLQNTIAGSLGDTLTQRHNNLMSMLANLSSGIQVSSGGNLGGDHVTTPELRALVEKFVTSSEDVAYATLLNTEKKGISAGRMQADALDLFMQKELERAFTAAYDGRAYAGQPLSQGAGNHGRTLMLLAVPVIAGGRFVGLIGAFVDLDFLAKRLREVSRGGLEAYVVDSRGRLVVGDVVVSGGSQKYVTGQDVTRFEIVKNFVEQGQNKQLVATNEFYIVDGKESIAMLGTYRPVPDLGWAVVAQKRQSDAYSAINEMQRNALLLALGAVFFSVVISVIAAKRITTPLATLTESSRAIARGDFSQRVQLKSRTEFGELAETFNHMTDDLERFVFDLKRAAEENRTLFLSSIQMLAGAVDEKDPYTRGHSDRVTRYSVLLATELGLTQEEVEQIRIAAQLHDVGKIGIEDRILKKPGALTPDEYEIMKTHTIKGANILRPVAQLENMIPGIELHHESLDGRGYPHGLRGDQLPLMPRVIMVADTFDAMTTNRPYQAAMDPEYVVRIIASLANTKFDPRVVTALESVFGRGGLRVHRAAAITPVPDAAAVASDPAKFEQVRAGVAATAGDTGRVVAKDIGDVIFDPHPRDGVRN